MFSNHTVVSAVLPAMAIRGSVPLPNNEIRLEVGRKESIAALKAAAASKKYIVLFVQNDQNVDKPGINDINHTGVVAKIIYNMVGQTFHKVKLLGIVLKLLEFVVPGRFGTRHRLIRCQ